MSSTEKIAIGSILVGLVVLALKTFAWWLTGSVALMSDAMESIVNVATAIAALIAIRIAARPADRDHPYGHHKAEFFSAVLEGVMIIVAALLILREAWHGFLAPKMLDAPLEGLLVNGIAPDGSVNWLASGAVRCLREAETRLAKKGWTLLNTATAWIRAQHPDQHPQRYGCGSWRQVIHESQQFEIRKMVNTEQRLRRGLVSQP